MEPDNPLLDDYALSLVANPSPRVCFLPTASGDSPAYVARFYRAFAGRCIPSDLTLIDSALPRRPGNSHELAEFVRQQDIFYVGGGNTVNLLALWRAHGLDRILRAAWTSGAVLCGVSAGMLCWFAGGVTDSFGQRSSFNNGLSFLPDSACPHYDGDDQWRPTFHRALVDGLPAGFAADDGAALHFHGTRLFGAVSSRPNALAYRVSLVNGAVQEEPMPTHFLGSPASTCP